MRLLQIKPHAVLNCTNGEKVGVIPVNAVPGWFWDTYISAWVMPNNYTDLHAPPHSKIGGAARAGYKDPNYPWVAIDLRLFEKDKELEKLGEYSL